MADDGEIVYTFESDIIEHANNTNEQDLIEFTNLKENINLSIRMSTFTQDTTIRVFEKTSGGYIDGEKLTFIGRTSGSEDDKTGVATVSAGVITSANTGGGGSGYQDNEKLTIIGNTSGANGAVGTATVVVELDAVSIDDGGGVYDKTSERIYPTEYEAGTDTIVVILNGNNQDIKITLQSGTVEGEIRYVSVSNISEYRT